jgi:hypothetical protein
LSALSSLFARGAVAVVWQGPQPHSGRWSRFGSFCLDREFAFADLLLSSVSRSSA